MSNRRNCGNGTTCQEGMDCIIYFGGPRFISQIAERNKNHHALTSAREQYPTGIEQVGAGLLLTHPLPPSSFECQRLPTCRPRSQICVRADTSPIQLKSLNVKFSRNILQSVPRNECLRMVLKTILLVRSWRERKFLQVRVELRWTKRATRLVLSHVVLYATSSAQFKITCEKDRILR
jgi:hypothetical protein